MSHPRFSTGADSDFPRGSTPPAFELVKMKLPQPRVPTPPPDVLTSQSYWAWSVYWDIVKNLMEKVKDNDKYVTHYVYVENNTFLTTLILKEMVMLLGDLINNVQFNVVLDSADESLFHTIINQEVRSGHPFVHPGVFQVYDVKNNAFRDCPGAAWKNISHRWDIGALYYQSNKVIHATKERSTWRSINNFGEPADDMGILGPRKLSPGSILILSLLVSEDFEDNVESWVFRELIGRYGYQAEIVRDTEVMECDDSVEDERVYRYIFYLRLLNKTTLIRGKKKHLNLVRSKITRTMNTSDLSAQFRYYQYGHAL